MIPNLRYTGRQRAAELCEALAEIGLGAEACRQKASMFAQVVDALEDEPSSELAAFYVPGRIEVLGKHTDYAGGRSVVAAVERGLVVAVLPGEGNLVRVRDVSTGQHAEFPLDPELTPRAGHWSNYPMTVARRLARNFPGARRGATIALASDLPPAAGMSSSSALMVAIFLALDHVNRVMETEAFRLNAPSLPLLAGYLGTVENGQTFGSLEGDRGVGTFGGSEDHTAMLCSRPGHLSQYAYCPVRLERRLPLPDGYLFAVATSGLVAEKTGEAKEKYNRASQLASEIQRLWTAETGRHETLAAAVASSPDAPNQLRALIQKNDGSFRPEDLAARLEQFLVENEQVIPKAGDALVRGDLGAFGECVAQSQWAAEELLGNQVPETAYLARSARQCGAIAASAFGAGFGGSVWAMVPCDDGRRFLDDWSAAYRQQFPDRANGAAFFLSGAGPAAFQIC